MAIIVRPSTAQDIACADTARELQLAAQKTHDIVPRDPELLREKIVQGLSVLAFDETELVGFGYISAWNDKTLSHSGVVVHERLRGTGLFRRMKEALIEIGNEQYSNYDIICLTTSPSVRTVNTDFGYEEVPLLKLSSDKRFWDGCKGCKRYEEVNAENSPAQENPVGTKCCCDGMRLYKSS